MRREIERELMHCGSELRRRKARGRGFSLLFRFALRRRILWAPGELRSGISWGDRLLTRAARGGSDGRLYKGIVFKIGEFSGYRYYSASQVPRLHRMSGKLYGRLARLRRRAWQRRAATTNRTLRKFRFQSKKYEPRSGTDLW